ncbi:MAG TPA: VWA domain-containing protein, partial [Candidatus Angelobacter sp.]
MRFALPCRALALSLVALCFSGAYSQSNPADQSSASPASGTSQSPTTLRTNTRLVVVDVVATDSRGGFVDDLKADDLKISEEGNAQKISSFSFHSPGKTNTVVASPLPVNVVTNAPAFQSSSLNVMLLDTLNGDFGEQAYVKDQLQKYLSQAKLAHPIALFAMENHLVMLHDFTTDAAALKSSVEKFRPPARFINGETATSRASAFTTFGDFHTSERDIATTLNQLNALAKTLAGYPGRKNLIWLSEGFPINLFPDNTMKTSSTSCTDAACSGGLARAAQEGTGQGDYKDYAFLIKKVSDALMNAQVAVYVVDAGVVGKDERMASHDTMRDVADRTGGKA